MAGKKKVAYFYDAEFAQFYFGQNHPMKPHRLAMTHQLVLGYGLHKHMEVHRVTKAYPHELAQFHTQSYVDFLARITPRNAHLYPQEMRDHNFNEDCPVFGGLFDFCRLYAGASIQGAARLNNGLADIAINWGGGLHHAKKSEASGFCYVNDLVLAILELLKRHARVLYIDIDVHHGDGVEEAFYLTDRVMTVSFHKYGDYFFPGTGDITDVGEHNGRYYSVNVPLRDGTSDETFHALFKPIMSTIMEVFQPGAIVMQCGADSLAHDRLGCFNLSMQGHGEAVEFMRGFGVPMLVTGGGGYTKHNVARCWTHETAILVGRRLPNSLPPNDYREYYAPDYSLNVAAHKVMEDSNKPQYVERLRNEIIANIKHLEHAPGTQFEEVPPEAMLPQYELDDGPLDPTQGELPVRERLCKYAREHVLLKENELYEDDGDNAGD
ncbi:histone deacetylase [Raphidocelis subcapitata]|uniref:Histone deacetylase n=1 Tax=Raphidocelis subcapitata TaxID=307507 RepID=A0A2V0PH16_9CHLO|nr:histone deacetylase [Raphidocelis subcapitata]|eukprot:GBF99104.1 histone deacetylase [Raphidocelis subcapitata]